jgi:hypothetical protein
VLQCQIEKRHVGANYFVVGRLVQAGDQLINS